MFGVVCTRSGAGPVAWLDQQSLFEVGEVEVDHAIRGDHTGVDDLPGFAGVAEEDRHGGGNPVQ